MVAALDAEATEPSAWALPLTPAWWGNGWASPRWRFRRGRLVLLPGDSPAGARMPLSSVSWTDPEFEGEEDYTHSGAELSDSRPEAVVVDPDETPSRTALVVQARDGLVHLFLPPLEKLEKFAELVGLLDEVVREIGVPVVFEGYPPPPDSRAEAADGDPRSRRDRGQRAPDLDLDRVQRADREPVRDGAPVPARHRDVRPGRSAQRHRRRQPHHPRRSGAGRGRRCCAGPTCWSACSPTGSTTPPCRTCSRVGSSGRPARRRASTRAARRPCTSWRSPSPRSSG